MFEEGQRVLLQARVYKTDNEQSFIEFMSCEGAYSIRVPNSELMPDLRPEITWPEPDWMRLIRKIHCCPVAGCVVVDFIGGSIHSTDTEQTQSAIWPSLR